MENEIIYNEGKKRVRKKGTLRPCCPSNGCTNRTKGELCKDHSGKTWKRTGNTKKGPNAADIQGSNERKTKLIAKSLEYGAEIVCIVSKKDKTEHNINSDYHTIRDDRCKFICKCRKEDVHRIRSIIFDTGMLCIDCRNIIKQQKRKKTNKKKYDNEDHMQIASIKNKIKETGNTNKKIKSNKTYDKAVKEFESKLKEEMSAFKIQRMYKKVKSKLYIGRIILLTRAFYMHLKDPDWKLSYKSAIVFLKSFRFSSTHQYKIYFKNYEKIPIYLSPRRRTYPNFSWTTYLSNIDFKNRKKFKHINKTYKETSEFAQNVVWPWVVKNGHDHLGWENLWNKYVEVNNSKSKNNRGINGYPIVPRHHYGRNAKNEEWKKNGDWEGFFGNPEKTHTTGKNGRRIMTQKTKLRIAHALIKNTNHQQNEDDLLYPGIYLYIFPDGKKYVGQTNGTILNRLEGHLRDAYNQKQDGCKYLDNKTRDLIKKVNNNKLPEDFDKWQEIFLKKVKIIVLERIEQGDLADEEYWKLLNDRELYFIKEHKCYVSSKDYDGKMGLNCNPGEGGKEMRKRDENKCYDHYGKLLENGVESIKIRGEIVGYKARKRIKYKITISIGKSYDFTLDKKLKIAKEFKNLKITSVKDATRIIAEFKQKYNLNNKEIKNTKSRENIDHKGKKLPTGIFYNPKEKYYKFSLGRLGVRTENRIFQEDCGSLDEQKKEAIFWQDKIKNTPLNSDELHNKTRHNLCKYIKDKAYPILTSETSWYGLFKKIQKCENPETKQEAIDEYEQLKEWHQAPNFPEGWKRMWGRITTRGPNKGWKDDGHFTFKNQQNIIFTSEKPAKKYIGVHLPDFNKIVNELSQGLKCREFRTELSKYIWKESKQNNTKGWTPYIEEAWKRYKKIENPIVKDKEKKID